MPGKTPQIEVTNKEEETLPRWVTSRTLPKQSVDRAIMILDRKAGKPVKQIAQELRQLIEGLIERHNPESKPFK